jgi:SAM-dependent methyltransferase
VSFDRAYQAAERSTWLREVFPTVVGLPSEVEPYSFVPLSGLEEIAAALRMDAGGLLVDVACGRGGPGMWVARQVGAELCGVDGSKVAVAGARRRAFGSRMWFVVGDLAATGLASGVADAVMCVDALQFATDRALVAGELRRVVRPGGRVALTCWEGDAGVSARFASLRCGEVLRNAGFVDVQVVERPEWEDRRRAAYEAALEVGPSDDPGLTRMQAEARTGLPQMPLLRRVLAVATR